MSSLQIIPAAAGYYALWRLDMEPGYGRSPIIGWYLDIDEGLLGATYPVIEGAVSARVEAILCPDGTVNESDSGKFFESLDEWQHEPNAATT